MEKIKLGFLGYGNIGSGTYKILMDTLKEKEEALGISFEIEKILVKDLTKKRSVIFDESLLTVNPDEITKNSNVDIVVEFLGGAEPARTLILSALRNGKPVVTANKEVLAKHWEELHLASLQYNAPIYFEASVAGGIPIIKLIKESLQANRITEVMGIINGTTNYILSQMEDENKSFVDALKQAQNLGYAEPDPTSDIEGHDAMYKLSILSNISFGASVSTQEIYREGISNIDMEDVAFGRELGFALKLLAIGKNGSDGVETRVHPTFIPSSHPLASVKGSYNAIFIQGDAIGNLMLYGRGAGDMPTGSAVVSDIMTAGREIGNKSQTNLVALNYTKPSGDWQSEFFIRFTVEDEPGVLADIAGVFGRHNVSIASVIQKGRTDNNVPLIFVTHTASKNSIDKAIRDIRLSKKIKKINSIIHVER